MKKVLSIVLALVITLGCICTAVTAMPEAQAVSFETENGVKVEIAPFLYKSKLHQMEFPSKQSYEIKEKSVEGDYAISRELNDLSYTFVFPAGTTKIGGMLSLDGETNWRGFSVNAEKSPSYWPKDAEGNVDYSQPVTFSRDEVTAERDEYGVIYREYLMDNGVEGFRDYDKIYWKLSYICDGETFSEYFNIKLYDYDKAEKHTVKAVNFNVAGLPFAALNGVNVGANEEAAGKYLSENGFDIVAVQEDFGYHAQLAGNMNGFSYTTSHTGGIPGGDGLNIFTKDMPIYNETRVPWEVSSGILSDGSDELTPKGFVYTVMNSLAQGIIVFAGQNMGAGNGLRARKAYIACRNMGLLVAVAGSLALFPLRGSLVQLLSNDLATQAAAFDYMFWVLLMQPFLSLFQNYLGAFNGSGHTGYSFLMSTLRLWAIRLPLILIFRLVTDVGANGVWYSMTISNFIILLIGFLLFRRIDFTADGIRDTGGA